MPRPVLLLAFADPTRTLRLVDEQHAVRDALRDREGIEGRRGESRWEIVERSNASLPVLRQAFADARGRVVGFHYAGHASGDRLLLEGADGARADAHAAGLAEFLGAHRAGLQFVFLNACSTGGQVDALLRAGVPAVIATSREIRDDLAVQLSTAFYEALAGGAGLRRAFEEAQACVRTQVGDTPRDAYRALALDDGPESPDTWPWALSVAPGADSTEAWSLGAAVGDHALGMPPLPPSDLPPSPYRRLLPFTAREARVFFGRGASVHRLYDRVKDASAAPVVLLHGQSGAGKSSMLDAGLVPRLGAEFDVCYARRDPSVGLCGTLRASLGTENGACLKTLWQARSSPMRPLVVIVDQVEEAFTRAVDSTGGDAEVAGLVDELAKVFGDPTTRPPGKVILSFRKEWLPEIETPLIAARLHYAKEFLGRLDEDGVVEAIRGPATIPEYALHIVDEDRLSRSIAQDLLRDPESPVAPTLQVLLTKMWADASAGAPNVITFDAALYRRMRDGAALGPFLDEQLVALGADFPDEVRTGLALDLLAFHTTSLATAERREWSEVTAAYSHVPQLAALVARLVDLSLLVDIVRRGDSLGDTGPCMLAHDTLAPLVRRLYDASVLPGQRARRVLEGRAGEWANEAIGRPLDDADLAFVEGGRLGMRAWTTDEARLVAASVARRAADARERADRARRRVQARRLSWAATALVAALGIGATVAGVLASRAARRARVAAIVTAAAAQDDPLDATLLLASIEPEDDEPVSGLAAVASMLARPVPHAVIDAGRVPNGKILDATLALSADGAFLLGIAETDSDRTVLAWRADGIGGPRPLTVPGPVVSVAPAPTGHSVLVGWANGAVRLLSLDSARAPRRVVDVAPPLRAARFVGDDVYTRSVDTSGRGVRRWWKEGRGGQWSVVDSAPVYTLIEGIVARMRARTALRAARTATDSAIGGRELERARDPDLAAGGRSVEARQDTVILHRTDRGALHADTIIDQRFGNAALALSRDGRRLLAQLPGGARVWDTDDVDTFVDLVDSAVVRAAFSPDGNHAITIDAHQRVRVFRLAGGPARRTMVRHDRAAGHLAFDARGAYAATTNSSEAVAVSRVDGTERPRWLGRIRPDSTWPQREVVALALSDDARRIVMATRWFGRPDSLWTWSVDRPNAPVAIGDVPYDALTSIAISADRRHVIVLRAGSRPEVWSLDGLDRPVPLTRPEPLFGSGFSADGRWYAVRDSGAIVHVRTVDGSARGWDIQVRDGSLYQVVLSPDARHVVIGGEFGGWLVALPSGRATKLRANMYGQHVAFSADGRRLALIDDRGLFVIELDAGGRRLDLPLGRSAVSAFAFAPDGRHLAISTFSGDVQLWATDWPTLIAAARRTTSVCLAPSKRRDILGESDSDATRGWAACERAHGRPTTR